ncbi:ParC family partition-associated protein [Undibacterium sp. WLHG33]|uniref:ParC family partition-associated protein n=1 Tax=Undibacterium sp. WLHG33 TaxID=3412482 RepID=UPI003C2BB9A1
MLTTTASVVAPKVLKELIAAGSVSAARVEPGDKGLLIVVRAGMNERVLGAARGGLRYFQSLDGAASVLQGYGIMKFDGLCRNKVERTKNVARVRKIKKLNYKTVQLWTKADLWRACSLNSGENVRLCLFIKHLSMTSILA